MQPIALSTARHFSLARVERRSLVAAGDMHIELVCFEAGQREALLRYGNTVVYQALEGEALVRVGDTVVRLSAGRLLPVAAGVEHGLENAGGGLLVVMATRAGTGVVDG
jgi:mannose-6-phosphate isomerase-like protein (cupin superfamily)